MDTDGTTDIKLYKNETLLTSSFTSSALAETYTNIGNATRQPNGKIVEVIYYNSRLSDSDRNKVLNYLNNKYGIY